ncbi:arginase family protein [Patescibacteria group bacterium]|nr:arginase family protein [Patescibacteria group bacterium]
MKKKYPDKRLGVIWIDAHADLHSPYTTPSGNMHGMPVAVAMGFDKTTAEEVQKGLAAQNLHGNVNTLTDSEAAQWDELCHLGGVYPMIKKEDMVYIDIRDIENEEKWYIDTYVKHFDGEYLQDHGIDHVVEHTLQHLNNCDMIYVSFDIDSIDGRIVRGTGTPVKDGLTQYQAQELLKALYKSEKLVSLEIVEINPLLDDVPGNSVDVDGVSKACQFQTRNGTAEIAFNIIKYILQ